jgi:hypothetical protein
MFDILESGSRSDDTTFHPYDTPEAVPLERVEAESCELAGHLAAATCRFLVLLGDFDARRGWASWEMTSCAAWLSWKCQMSSGTAREHVRVARALRPAGDPRGVRPDGSAVPASPPLPRPGGTIGDCHDADITPETIIPPWYGERLDLDYASRIRRYYDGHPRDVYRVIQPIPV